MEIEKTKSVKLLLLGLAIFFVTLIFYLTFLGFPRNLPQSLPEDVKIVTYDVIIEKGSLVADAEVLTKKEDSILFIDADEHYAAVGANVDRALILINIINKDRKRHSLSILQNLNYLYFPTKFASVSRFSLEPNGHKQFQIPYYKIVEKTQRSLIVIIIKCSTCRDKVEVLEFAFGSKEKLSKLMRTGE